MPQKGFCSASTVNASAIPSGTAVTHLSGECSISQQQLKCCSCGGKHTANYRGSVKRKEAKAVLSKQLPVECIKGGGAPSPPTAPKAKRAETSNEQESGTWLEPRCPWGPRCQGYSSSRSPPLLTQSLKLLRKKKLQPPVREARLLSQRLESW